MLDRIILSANLDPMYIDFIPFVTRAWKKLFNCKVTTAILLPNDFTPELHQEVTHKCRVCDEIIFYHPIEGIPDANLSKIIRLFTATLYNKEVVSINDADLLPLQTAHFQRLLARRGEGNLLCVGIDVYNGTPDEGKFPMGYFTAEGNVFSELVNPQGLSFEDLAKSWVGIKVFDNKEDISSMIDHQHKDCFSDESLARVLISRWNKKKTNVKYVNRGFIRDVDSVDRANWRIDENKLRSNQYVEAHMLRPYKKYREQLHVLFEHLGVLS